MYDSRNNRVLLVKFFFSEYNIFVLSFRSVVFNGDGKINNILYNYNVDEFVENKDSFRNLEN